MTDNGILIQDGDVATIEFNRRLAASPERVWAALTNADELAAWLTPGTIEGRIGGFSRPTASHVCPQRSQVHVQTHTEARRRRVVVR